MIRVAIEVDGKEVKHLFDSNMSLLETVKMLFPRKPEEKELDEQKTRGAL